jgi:hypothetical protein
MKAKHVPTMTSFIPGRFLTSLSLSKKPGPVSYLNALGLNNLDL